MKTIKTKIMALMLIAALTLTGCMNADIGIVINSDGSGSLEVVMTIDKQAYIDTLTKSTGMQLSASDIKELETAMIAEGCKIVTIDGKEYYQTSEKQTIKRGELQETFGGDGVSYVTTDTVYIVMDMRMDEGSTTNEFAGAADYGVSLDDIPADSVKVTATVQMPKAIVNTNGTIDKANSNKASFNLPLGKKTTVFATTKNGVTASTVKTTVKKLNTVNAPKIKKLKANKVKANAKKATITLKIKKVKAAKNYQIEYSTKKSFKNAASKTTKKTTYTIKKLKKGKKYYVRVRACKTNYAGVDIYSKWTKKSVKTKK